MAVSKKYGRINISKIGDDEPVFILRAQDLLAGPAIETYEILTRSHHLPLAEQVKAEIDRFKSWTGPKKLPD
jgi:hypothetical protein